MAPTNSISSNQLDSRRNLFSRSLHLRVAIGLNFISGRVNERSGHPIVLIGLHVYLTDRNLTRYDLVWIFKRQINYDVCVHCHTLCLFGRLVIHHNKGI